MQQQVICYIFSASKIVAGLAGNIFYMLFDEIQYNLEKQQEQCLLLSA